MDFAAIRATHLQQFIETASPRFDCHACLTERLQRLPCLAALEISNRPAQYILCTYLNEVAFVFTIDPPIITYCLFAWSRDELKSNQWTGTTSMLDNV